jgi:molybdate transport system ATP-binding protein
VIEAHIRLRRAGFALDVAFTAEAGVTALFGPSGSGKTTILNAIAGLERPEEGRIAVDGETFYDSGRRIDVPVHRRRLGYVFQDALLFPHLTVMQNLRYGCRQSGEAIDHAIALLGLGALLARRPATLSGGERQRVAIGRALLTSPRLLLMDEPLASLDLERKREVLPHIEKLRDEYRLPILYVSHAADEVARLADRIVAIEHGRIVSQGPPQAALTPRLFGEAGRFGRLSVLTGRAGTYDGVYGLTTVNHDAGPIAVAGRLAGDRDIRIVIHATDVSLATFKPEGLSIRTALAGAVVAVEPEGEAAAIVTVRLAGGQALAAAATRKAIDALGLSEGHAVWCLIKAVSIDERWLRSA